jgi:hypothetical protein
VTGAELAYQEAVRAISRQADTIDTLRSNTSTLLSAASLTAAFLGGQSLRNHHLHGFGIAAVCCFVVVGVLTIAIMFPRKRWQFGLDPDAIIAMYGAQPAGSDDEIYRDAAHNLHQYRLHNAAQIEMLFWIFRAASIFLVCGVLAWILELATR